jgi:hypothetical protein
VGVEYDELDHRCDSVIGQKSFLVFVSQVGNSLLSHLGLFFITQCLGSDTFGTIAGTMALVGVFNSF